MKGNQTNQNTSERNQKGDLFDTVICVPGTQNFAITLGTQKASSQTCRMNEAFQTRTVLSPDHLLYLVTQYIQLNAASAVFVGRHIQQPRQVQVNTAE